MIIAVIVVVAAVVFLGRGGGGELSVERNDYVPLDLGPVSATDVALLRPPTGLWGYSMQATDRALEQIAESIRERDVRIVALEQLVTDLSRDQVPMPLLASPYSGARHRRPHAGTADTEAVEVPDETPVLPESSTPPTTPTISVTPVAPASSAAPPSSDTPASASWETPATAGWEEPATEQVRFPFEPPRPSGEMSGPPPERSHD